MDSHLSDLIKEREIYFASLSVMADPAASAVQLLDGSHGVLSVQRHTPTFMRIQYRLDHITLRILEDALHAMGYRFEDTMLNRLKRALYHFTEETQLANLGFQPHSKSTTQIFINSYQQRQHGCRDERPVYYHHFN